MKNESGIRAGLWILLLGVALTLAAKEHVFAQSKATGLHFC